MFVRRTGPAYKMMVARQEMKGNFFKRSAHIMCNFMNVPYTLAWRHQFFAYLSLNNGSNIKDDVVITSGSTVATSAVPWPLPKSFEHAGDVIVSSKVTISGTIYSKGHMILVDVFEGEPIFGRLHAVVVPSMDTPAANLIFIFDEYETLRFESHYGCHIVKAKPSLGSVFFSDLADFHPLDSYASRTSSRNLFVPLRYHVF